MRSRAVVLVLESTSSHIHQPKIELNQVHLAMLSLGLSTKTLRVELERLCLTDETGEVNVDTDRIIVETGVSEYELADYDADYDEEEEEPFTLEVDGECHELLDASVEVNKNSTVAAYFEDITGYKADDVTVVVVCAEAGDLLDIFPKAILVNPLDNESSADIATRYS